MVASIGIEGRILESAAQDIRVYPYANNRASEIGHDCLRYLVYCRTRNEERLLHDAQLEIIFQEGRLHEDDVERKLKKAGYVVLEQQRSFRDDDLQLSGHLDWKLMDPKDDRREVWPCEAKSMSPHIFERASGWDDVMAEMLAAREPWIRKYPAQLTCYMAKNEAERALFIFKNKSTGRVVDRVVEFSEEYWRALKMRAEAVNFHVASETLPGRIQDDRMCTECAFRHVCMPDVQFGDEAEFVAELTPLLDRRDELLQLKKQAAWLRELDEVDKQIKSMVKDRNKVIAGRWRGKAATVSVPEKTVRAYSYKRWTWKAVEEGASP